MMSGMLGGAAIQSWANYSSAAASQGMSEREAMLDSRVRSQTIVGVPEHVGVQLPAEIAPLVA